MKLQIMQGKYLLLGVNTLFSTSRLSDQARVFRHDESTEISRRQKSMKSLNLAIITAVLLLISVYGVSAQSTRVSAYRELSAEQQTTFVHEQMSRIAREMSGRDYEFTSGFASLVQKSVDSYARRVGNGRGDPLGKADIRFTIERGQRYAPILAKAFKARNVSPLIGLYIPFIESEYINIQSPNAMGAMGMFQFLPQTGSRYGLSTEDLLNVERSADAAALYILDSLELFKGDPMSEALALLSYNRGGGKVVQELQLVLDTQNRACSICALAASSDRLDRSFREESVYYVPMFFAAAIVGENPRAFGLRAQPLSWYGGQ
jgi:hypothetical protein